MSALFQHFLTHQRVVEAVRLPLLNDLNELSHHHGWLAAPVQDDGVEGVVAQDGVVPGGGKGDEVRFQRK